MDTALPRALIAFIRTGITSIEILLVIVWTTPGFLFALIPLAAIYIYALVCVYIVYSLE
jgi:hypothetical protein